MTQHAVCPALSTTIGGKNRTNPMRKETSNQYATLALVPAAGIWSGSRYFEPQGRIGLPRSFPAVYHPHRHPSWSLLPQGRRGGQIPSRESAAPVTIRMGVLPTSSAVQEREAPHRSTSLSQHPKVQHGCPAVRMKHKEHLTAGVHLPANDFEETHIEHHKNVTMWPSHKQ